MSNKVNTKKKVEIKNMKKFVTFVIAFIIVIFIVVLVILLNNKVEKIDENTNISQLNAKKYSVAIKENYELSGKKDLFIQDYFAVQNAVGMYLLNNSTLDDNSFNGLLGKINEVLKKKDWAEIGTTMPTSWNGAWYVNEKGNVKFKFSNKEMEPSWSTDVEVSSFIELN